MRISRTSYAILALFFVPTFPVRHGTAGNGSPPSRVAAGELLRALAGTWQFRMYSAGRTDPIASGERVMHLMSDSTKLVWSETVVGQADTGTGVLGHNTATGAYYMLGVYTHRPNPVVLVGRLDPSVRTIAFDPAPTSLGLARSGTFTASILHLIDENRFEWRAADGSWQAVFTRVGPS